MKLTAFLVSLFFTRNDLQKRVAIDTQPRVIWMMNSFFSPVGSCFRSNTTPIMISTIPTIILPQNIEKVESRFTSSFRPPLIDTT